VIILAVFWLRFRFREFDRLQFARALLDIGIMMLALARFCGSSIPPSGHALFLTHSLISINNRYYRSAALMMLLVTIGLKISWGDYASWSYGILIGLMSGAWWVRLGNKNDNQAKPPESSHH